MSKVKGRKADFYKSSGYIEGNAVRHLQEVPKRTQTEHENRDQKLRNHVRRNREKALQINMGYVIFLAAATIAVVVFCVNYLKIQSEITGSISKIAEMESELLDLKSENDESYNRIMSSIDLEHIKQVAIQDLGMVYATEDQVVMYESKGSDYVRQYQNIPEAKKSGILGLFGQ